MRIYVTKFFMYQKDIKPFVEKTSFGKDMRYPIMTFCLDVLDIVKHFNNILHDQHLFCSVYKEIKFTITFKF